MRYKTLGKTGLNVSVATVGTWAIGGSGWGAVDRQDSITAIRSMLDNDVNIIDTAPIYGCGYSEEVVGEAIKGYDRDKLIISTKCGLVWGEGAPKGGRDISGKSIMKEIDDSLRRLGLDYIDIYYVHKPDFLGTPFEDTMGAMMKLKEMGKIGHIGLSNFSIEQTEECMKYGDVEVIQPPFSMIDQRERPVLEFAKQHDMGVMTYGSLGAGMLTGTIREMPDWDPKDMRFVFYDYFKEPKFSKAQELLKVLDKIAEARNVPVAQVAVNWITAHPLVDTALMGVRNKHEADENCSATAWELTPEEIAVLDAAVAEYERETPAEGSPTKR